MNGDEVELRNAATKHLIQIKEKEVKAVRSKKFVTKRVDSRTIVMARPAMLKEIIDHINEEKI